MRFIEETTVFANPILILTGGEPLLRPDFFDIAAYAVQKGLRIAIATNGTLIDEALARKIAETGVSRVSISLDGARAETHDDFRGIPGSYAAALQGLQHLQALGVPCQINTTVAKHNAGELAAILRLCLDLGVQALHIFMLVPVGCGVEIAHTQMLPPEQYETTLTWLFDQSQRDIPLELKATCAPHYMRILYQRAKAAGRPVERRAHGMAALTKGCLAGSAVCFVSRVGQVQPCGYLPLAAGNIRETPFRKIWETSPLFQSLRDPSRLEGKCGLCEYNRVCGGCRARAYSHTGNYLSEAPYCLYVPRRLR
jgi:heme b synthase